MKTTKLPPLMCQIAGCWEKQYFIHDENGALTYLCSTHAQKFSTSGFQSARLWLEMNNRPQPKIRGDSIALSCYLDNIASSDLEAECLARAIKRGNEVIARLEEAVKHAKTNQWARIQEQNRQRNLAILRDAAQPTQIPKQETTRVCAIKRCGLDGLHQIAPFGCDVHFVCGRHMHSWASSSLPFNAWKMAEEA